MTKYLLLIAFHFHFITGMGQLISIKDEPFSQEYHEAYPFDGKINKIVAGPGQDIWIATASGIWKKSKDNHTWIPVLNREDRAPSFSLACDNDGKVWMGTWNAVWRTDGRSLNRINGTEGPISVLVNSPSGMYAIGPMGMWLYNGITFIKQHAIIPRSVRDAVVDKKGELWIASDVGLYHVANGSAIHLRDTSV